MVEVGEVLPWGPGCEITVNEVNAAVSVGTVALEGRQEMPRVENKGSATYITVLEGGIKLFYAGKIRELEPEQTAGIGRGIPYTFFVNSEDSAKLLVQHRPPYDPNNIRQAVCTPRIEIVRVEGNFL